MEMVKILRSLLYRPGFKTRFRPHGHITYYPQRPLIIPRPFFSLSPSLCTLFFPRSLFASRMSFPSSYFSSPHLDSTLDRSSTSSSNYDGRNPLRTRPRRFMALIFAAGFAIVILLSQHPLLAEYTQSYRSSLDAHASDSPTDMITAPSSVHTVTVEVERQLEPVVFALLMFSENSAKEGAILLKVPAFPLEFFFSIQIGLNNKSSRLVRDNVHQSTPPFPHRL